VFGTMCDVLATIDVALLKSCQKESRSKAVSPGLMVRLRERHRYPTPYENRMAGGDF
jgi:hypothetical protein